MQATCALIHSSHLNIRATALNNKHSDFTFSSLLMVEFERVRDGYLQFGIIILSLPVEMYPDTSHSKSMSWLWLANVRYRNALQIKKNKHTWKFGKFSSFSTQITAMVNWCRNPTSFSGYRRSNSFITGRKSASAFFWILPEMNCNKTHIRWSRPLIKPRPAS